MAKLSGNDLVANALKDEGVEKAFYLTGGPMVDVAVRCIERFRTIDFRHEQAAAMAAHRHSRNYVVTASIDHLDFRVPVHVGDLVILRSSVNRVYRTSMEVGVKVWVENYLLDHCEHVSSAYLTFVAVDAAGRHLSVPPVVPETDEQRRRYQDAGRRREIRRLEIERKRTIGH